MVARITAEIAFQHIRIVQWNPGVFQSLQISFLALTARFCGQRAGNDDNVPMAPGNQFLHRIIGAKLVVNENAVKGRVAHVPVHQYHRNAHSLQKLFALQSGLAVRGGCDNNPARI